MRTPARRTWCIAAVLALGCAPAAARQRGTETPASLAGTSVQAPRVTVVRLHDHTEVTLVAPGVGDVAARGESVLHAPFLSCVGPRCDHLRRTVTELRQPLVIRGDEIASLNVRDASAEEVAAAAGLDRPGRPDARRDRQGAGGQTQASEEFPLEYVPRARHAIFASATSLLLSIGGGFSYSYRPQRMLAFSLGVGGSATLGLCPFGCEDGSGSAVGGQAAAHLLLGGREANLELAFGVAAVSANPSFFYPRTSSSEDRFLAFPSVFVGFRHHPVDGGFVHRIGLGWEFGLAFGVSAAFGHAF